MNIENPAPTPYWVGFELDGVLSVATHLDSEIGEPIKEMIELCHRMRKKGWIIKLFTIRADYPENIEDIKYWLDKQGLFDLEITRCKDRYLFFHIDSRCKQNILNTSKFLADMLMK